MDGGCVRTVNVGAPACSPCGLPKCSTTLDDIPLLHVIGLEPNEAEVRRPPAYWRNTHHITPALVAYALDGPRDRTVGQTFVDVSRVTHASNITLVPARLGVRHPHPPTHQGRHVHAREYNFAGAPRGGAMLPAPAMPWVRTAATRQADNLRQHMIHSRPTSTRFKTKG